MKYGYFFAIIILLSMLACVHAETFMPDEGIFAFREVEIHEINGVNFTIPTDYEVAHQNETQMEFKHDADNLTISVVKDAKVKKVKKDASKNITSGKTMFGSVEGYLVDDNGTYTFSYDEDGKLVVISSRDMSLMIGAMGRD